MTQVLLTQLPLSTLRDPVHLISFHLIALRKAEQNEKKVTSITTLHFRHHFYCLECLLHVSQTIITHNHGIELCKKKQALYTTQFKKFNFRLIVFCIYFSYLLLYIYACVWWWFVNKPKHVASWTIKILSKYICVCRSIF